MQFIILLVAALAATVSAFAPRTVARTQIALVRNTLYLNVVTVMHLLKPLYYPLDTSPTFTCLFFLFAVNEEGVYVIQEACHPRRHSSFPRSYGCFRCRGNWKSKLLTQWQLLNWQCLTHTWRLNYLIYFYSFILAGIRHWWRQTYLRRLGPICDHLPLVPSVVKPARVWRFLRWLREETPGLNEQFAPCFIIASTYKPLKRENIFVCYS